MRKSRQLRKLLTKKSKEKKEVLKKYFNRFYLACFYASIILGVRQKTSELKNRRYNSVDNKVNRKSIIGQKFDLNMNNNEGGDDEDILFNIKNKRIQILTKIFYKKDRLHFLIMKKTFEKLNLRVKLLSLQETKRERQSKVRTKKKGKHKARSTSTDKLNKKLSKSQNFIINYK